MSQAVLFDSAAEAWFWFIQTSQAKNDGARRSSGQGKVHRPCEPTDILTVLNRLYRGRRLTMDHLKVLKHYGERKMPPERDRPSEARSYHIWQEALSRLQEAFESKGIVVPAFRGFCAAAGMAAFPIPLVDHEPVRN